MLDLGIFDAANRSVRETAVLYIQRNVRSVRAMAGYFSDTHFASKSFKWNEDGAVAGFMTA